MPQPERSRPRYDPDRVGIGIVHVGLGAFHRAHQAVYVDRWLEHNGGGDWGICAANIRSNRAIVQDLQASQLRYHVVEFSDAEHIRVRQIGAIRDALFAADDRSALLVRLGLPSTRIVSLTVSEKGYYLNPASGELLVDAPAITADLAAPATPTTAPGLLLEALKRRRDAGLAPFTVLCCDNMPQNGERTQRAVLGLAARQSAELADWIKRSVSFPATMVDRIVPAVTPDKQRELDALIGAHDPAAVGCEAFSQWVIEDRFSAGRPDWETVGVEMVSDVRPWETMKLRLLNGAHSLLAYVGLWRGRTTVAEAVADGELRRLISAYFVEAAASLDPGTGLDPAAYAQSLLTRFGNDALEHRLSQIAMDGSQKLPQRWLDGAAANLAQGRDIRATAIGVAAWLRFVRGSNDAGHHWTVDDPLAAVLADCHRRHGTSEDVVAALLAVDAVFPAALRERDAFRRAVSAAYRSLDDAIAAIR
jgi:fructuronate reductase